MSVKILKLTNGETIMADVIDSNDRVVTINNALEVRTESSSRDKMHMLAHQWLPMEEEENIIYLNYNNIVGMSRASEEMQEYYVSAVTKILDYGKQNESDEEYMQKLLDMIKTYANTDSTSFH